MLFYRNAKMLLVTYIFGLDGKQLAAHGLCGNGRRLLRQASHRRQAHSLSVPVVHKKYLEFLQTKILNWIFIYAKHKIIYALQIPFICICMHVVNVAVLRGGHHLSTKVSQTSANRNSQSNFYLIPPFFQRGTIYWDETISWLLIWGAKF